MVVSSCLWTLETAEISNVVDQRESHSLSLFPSPFSSCIFVVSVCLCVDSLPTCAISRLHSFGSDNDLSLSVSSSSDVVSALPDEWVGVMVGPLYYDAGMV